MELSIEGTPEEIKKALQAISGSEEHEKLVNKVSKLSTNITYLTSVLSNLENITFSKN